MSFLQVNFEHSANAGILRYLGSPERLARSVSEGRDRPSCDPASISDPYYKLGTHPDLVERLWDELTVRLPASCRWVVYGTPVLIHPISGILFGFAGGTHTYALRLPPALQPAALAAGALPVMELYGGYVLSEIGDDWVFGRWLPGEEEWCRAAYDAAGTFPVPGAVGAAQ